MMIHRTFHFVATALLAAFVATLPASRLVAQEAQSGGDEWQQPPLPETFNALSMILSTSAARQTETIMIRITRWSTAEERDHLTTIINENPDALRDELQKQEEAGFIRGAEVGTRWTSERLRYAWQLRIEGTGKRRLILALDRPIGITVGPAQTRAFENTVSIIVLDVEENGQGDGILAVGSQVVYDQDLGRIVMKQYAAEPVRLTNVRKTG